MTPITFVIAVNNKIVFEKNSLASPIIASGHHEVIVLEDVSNSISAAYNQALEKAKNEIVIFCHQDVYFPEFWETLFIKRLDVLEEKDKSWGVLGLFGLTEKNHQWGELYTEGQHILLIKGNTFPKEIVSIDECVIILRKASGLRFDPLLPGFHLYGTDIVQTGLQKGVKSYIINAPVVHNATPSYFTKSFSISYFYMKQKWKHRCPIPTLICPITKLNITLLKIWVIEWWHKRIKKKDNIPINGEQVDPKQLSDTYIRLRP